MTTHKKDASYWLQLQKDITINGQAFINGEYVDAASGKTFACINPANGGLLANVAEAQSEDVDRAVACARETFNRGDWRLQPPNKRKRVLLRFAQLIRDNADELALLESLDMGKPVRNAAAGDIPGSAAFVQWCAEAIDKMYDEIAPSHHTSLGMITHEPLGVVAAIVPWNFPLLMACWKCAPALATGNSVVLKPSEKSPLTAIKLAQLSKEAGIPAGVFNVVPGFGHDAGKALGLHMDVDCIAFTGSTNVGKILITYSGQSNMKRTFMECGGKSPNIVFADAPDLDAAAKAAAGAIFYNQGEVCTAGSRLLVENSIREEFIAKVVEHSRNMQAGDPLQEDSYMGAIVDEVQMQRVLSYVESGKQEGAKLELGGSRVLTETGGFYVEPTIFSNVTADMKISKEEIFGPVLSVIGFDSTEEAIAEANDSIYGLAAALWTKDISKAHMTAKALQAGNVWVNNWDGGNISTPFGGFKQSGNGRDKSLHCLNKYTETKTTWFEF